MILRRDLERVIDNVLNYADLEGAHYSCIELVIEDLVEEVYEFLEQSERNGS